jgi:hypothetical protein
MVSASRPVAVAEWFDSAQLLIETNTMLLDDDGWDPAYFAVGDNGAGDYYCLELETGDVVLYSHEEDEFHELGPLDEWLASPVAESEPASPAVGFLGCAAIALLLLLILLTPVWFALRASP